MISSRVETPAARILSGGERAAGGGPTGGEALPRATGSSPLLPGDRAARNGSIRAGSVRAGARNGSIGGARNGSIGGGCS